MFEFASVEAFNEFPIKPAIVRELPVVSHPFLSLIPLHRHRDLKSDQIVVWYLSAGRLMTRAVRRSEVDRVVPAFWFRNQSRRVFSYEYISIEAVEEIGIEDRNIEGEVAALFGEDLVPEGYGLFSLWSDYLIYLEKKGVDDSFVLEQEKELDILLAQNNDNQGGGVLGNVEIQGFPLKNTSEPNVFLEFNDADSDYLFTTRKKYLDNILNGRSAVPLDGRGVYIGHSVQQPDMSISTPRIDEEIHQDFMLDPKR